MASLSDLNDKQNMLLTQLSYESDVLNDTYNGMTLGEIAQVENLPKGTRDKIQELCDAGLGSLIIKDVGNDSGTGFGAIAFTDENGNTGFSFRGTDGISKDSINDWGDNIVAMATGTSAQSAQAEAFFDMNRDENGNNYLYGHSKGGELSESVYVNNYLDIKGVHLLNPQPLNPYSLTPDQKIAIESDKVDIVIVEGDYVWFLGKLPSNGNIRIAKKIDGENSHLYSALDFDNGNIVQGEQPWWEYAAYFAVSKLTEGIQRAGGRIGLVYNSVVRVVDFVMNDVIPAAQEFIARVVEEIKKLGEELKEFAEKLGQFLSDTITRAKEWLKRLINKAYDFADKNPEVQVDTFKLKDYAERLSKVNKHLSKLDESLDGLYWKVGLLGLYNLMVADVMTGHSWKLDRVSTCLLFDAAEFEGLETELSSNLS